MKKLILILVLSPIMTIGQPVAKNLFTSTGPPESFKALNINIEKPKENALSKYIGHYKSELIANFEYDLFIEGGKLFGRRKGEIKKVEIAPAGPSKFLVKGEKVQIQFIEEVDGVQFMSVAKDEMIWLVKVD